MRYSAKERLIAKSLAAFPGLKQFLKRAYQTLNFIVYKKQYTFQSIAPIRVIGDDSVESFFGYYDKSPESECGKYIVYQQSGRKTTKLPSGQDAINVICRRLDDGKLIYQKSTFAYNWQQGARVHWVAANEFVYNSYSAENGYVAILVRILEDQVEELEIKMPIYESSVLGFFSLSFEKLQQLRPDYGYRCHESEPVLDPKTEGIYYQLKGSESWRLLVSLFQINQDFPIEAEGQLVDVPFTLQKFNHIMVNPSGNALVFLHRYYYQSRRIDRLFYLDMQSMEMKHLNRSSMVSHYCWKNDSELQVFMGDQKLGKDAYYTIDVLTGSIELFTKLSDRYGDGHPQAFNERWMVFDTYPNKSRMKELFLYEFASQEVVKLGEFLEPLAYFGETRCDLHPRINYAGNMVYIDSVHAGKRQLLQIDLTEKLKERKLM